MDNERMSYFQEIVEETEKLDRLANEYMAKLPFIPNDEVADRLYEKAWQIFEDNNKNWDNVPWWVQAIVDNYMPYYEIPKDGSLMFALGFSVASFEAHLRNLLEIAEGREEKELDFPYLAANIVDKKK